MLLFILCVIWWLTKSLFNRYNMFSVSVIIVFILYIYVVGVKVII